MEATVSVPTFEGPLGLLLELVERNKLEITTISIATITHEYLDRLTTATNQRDMAQFVELGARLIYVKSAALLPPSTDESELSPQAELLLLNKELEEYRQMRDVAKLLERRAKTSGACFGRSYKAIKSSVELPLPTIEIDTIARAFQEAMKRARPSDIIHKPKQVYDQALILKRLEEKIQTGPISLSQLLSTMHDRLEIIVTFVAVLELIKLGDVMVRQSSIFEDIHLEAIHV